MEAKSKEAVKAKQMISLMLTAVLQPFDCVFSTLLYCPLYTCRLEAMTAPHEPEN